MGHRMQWAVEDSQAPDLERKPYPWAQSVSNFMGHEGVVQVHNCGAVQAVHVDRVRARAPDAAPTRNTTGGRAAAVSAHEIELASPLRAATEGETLGAHRARSVCRGTHLWRT